MFHLVCVKLRPNRDTHKNIQGVHCQDFSRFKVFFKNCNNKNFQKVLFKIIKKKKIKIITDIKKSSMILDDFMLINLDWFHKNINLLKIRPLKRFTYMIISRLIKQTLLL